MSLAQHIAMVPAAAWPLGVGLLVNSTILFGNVGAGLAGAVPIAQGKLGRTNLGEKDKVRIWALFYKSAAYYIVPGILSTTALHLLAAYLTPSSRVRQLSVIAASVAITIPVHTLLLIMPTNKLLLAMDEKKGDDLTPAEKRDAPYLIDQWNRLHSWRYVQYTIGWVAGLGALLGVVGRW